MTERQTLTDRKHAAIVEAAVAEFSAHGFDAARMDSVADRAGVSKRTVYNHFASKEQLFRAIRNELVERARQVEPLDYDPSAPLREQLTEIARREVELLTSDEFLCLARVTIPAFMNCPAFASDTFSELQDRQGGIVRWIDAADADGRLQVADARRAAKQLTVLLSGSVFWPQIAGGQPAPNARERERVIDAAVAMFLDHYAP